MSDNYINEINLCSSMEPMPATWTAFQIIGLIVNLLTSLGCFYLIGSILSTKKVYTNTFNLYVAFLLLPDGLNNLMHGVFGILRVINCGGYPPLFGYVYEGSQFFYFFCNFYLNVVVAYEIYSILERSSRRVRTGPPEMRKALLQIASVNFAAILFGIWGGLNVPWSFFYKGDGGLFSTMGTMILFVSLMLIPIIYVVAIRIQIWRKDLLPKEGKTKTISIFFMRIMIVFFGFYVPNALLTQFAQPFGTYRDASFFGVERFLQLLHALQAIVTLYMVAYKEDIRTAAVSNFRKLSRFSVAWKSHATVETSTSSRKRKPSVQSSTGTKSSTHTVDNSIRERKNDNEETENHINGSETNQPKEMSSSSDIEAQ